LTRRDWIVATNWDEEFSTRAEEQRLRERACLVDLIKLDLFEEPSGGSIVNPD
jgi:hypothetical protein